MSTRISQSSTDDRDQLSADQTLRALLLASLRPATDRFVRRLELALANGDNGWHRLNIRVEGGRIKSVQLVLDEHVS